MFRFTIRELLILTVTAALAVGLVAAHRQNSALAAKNSLLETHKRFLWQCLEAAGCEVHNNMDGGSGISVIGKPRDTRSR